MLEFFKKVSPSDSEHSSKQSAADAIPPVSLVECDKVPDFIRINFPLLNQTSMICSEHHKYRKREDKKIDISVYFSEKDQYLVTENNKDVVLEKEFGAFDEYELKAHHVAPRTKVLENYNQILNNIVKEAAAKNFDKFQEGVNNVEFFKYIVGLCTEDLKSSREALKEAKSGLALYAIRVARLLKQRTMMQNAAELMKKFRERFQILPNLIHTLTNGDIANVYEAIPLIHDAKMELEKSSTLVTRFECLRNCEKYLDIKFEELQKNMHKGIENSFINWDEQKFGAWLKCWYLLQHHYPSNRSLVNILPTIVKQSIKQVRKQVIEGYITQKTSTPNMANGAVKVTEYVKGISIEVFPKLMNKLFNQMSVIMYNTHLCCRYLEGNFISSHTVISKLIEHNKDELIVKMQDKTTYNLSEFYTSVKAALLALKKDIWKIIQKKVVKVLNKAQINEMGYYEIINLLQFTGIFVEIGEDFSYSPSKHFRDAIWNFLKNYCTYCHNASLQNLKAMVAAEEWKRLPLPKDYKQQSLIQLLNHFPKVPQHVLSLLKLNEEPDRFARVDVQTIQKKSSAALSSFVVGNPFQIQDKQMNKLKFSVLSPQKGLTGTSKEESQFEEISPTERSDKPKEVEDQQKEVNEEDSEVVVSSSANFVVKHFEKYLLLMNLMRPYTLEIFVVLLENFQFLIYTVIKNFIPGHFRGALFTEMEVDLNNIKNIKDEELRLASLQNIHDLYLFQNELIFKIENYKHLRKYMMKILEFFEKSTVRINEDQIKDRSTGILFDLRERSVAIESVIFAHSQLKLLQTRALKIATNPEQANIIQEYYQTFEKIIPELRIFIYACFMPNLLSSDNIFQPIQTVKWDPTEPIDTPNVYINKVIQFVKDFYSLMDNLSDNEIPKRVQKDLKKDVVNFAFRKLIDNFSKIKKINIAGRNMMMNDFNHFVHAIGGIMDPRCNEKKEFCENYIKAWYFNVDELSNFIHENKDTYGLREMEALIQTGNVVKNLNKANKKELFAKIENEFIQFIRSKLQE